MCKVARIYNIKTNEDWDDLKIITDGYTELRELIAYLEEFLDGDMIKELQGKYEKFLVRNAQVEKDKTKDFEVMSDGCLYYRERLCIPYNEELKNDILSEAQCSPLTMYTGGNKMYQNLKSQYWWPSIKRVIAEFFTKCLTCQQVKVEHQVPSRLFKQIAIHEWKWE
ncbi:uncharacterized protein LOC120130000 [Hibiscus syriacus]|uniref:uncharacterized protein LOC120130000 n=1 Tax=Hibiscus syriacus TaxID=106335 RepID=UPI0019245FD4|nr:uncharacterized protein LOC120130000 [Hibiscus syriacus]